MGRGQKTRNIILKGNSETAVTSLPLSLCGRGKNRRSLGLGLGGGATPQWVRKVSSGSTYQRVRRVSSADTARVDLQPYPGPQQGPKNLACPWTRLAPHLPFPWGCPL